MPAYCVRCKRKTEDVSPKMAVAKNGRHMMRSTCKACNCKKCQFVSASAAKGKKGKGFWDSLARVALPIATDVAIKSLGGGMKKKRRVKKPSGEGLTFAGRY